MRAGLALVGATLAIVALEAVVRLTDPFGASYYRDTNRYLQHSVVLPPEAGRPDGRLFENAPNRALVTGPATFATDGAGLRAAGADEPAPLPRDEAAAAGVGLRILFLGDSVTLGWGVEYEDTWIARVEAEGRAAGGGAVEALNAGHLQYNTIQEVDWFLAHAPALEPDLVVLNAVVNDLDDSYALYRAYVDELARAEARTPTLAERANAAFHARLFGLAGILNHVRETRALRTPGPEDDLPIERRAAYVAGWPLAEDALDRLREACAALGADLVVFDHTDPRLPGYRAWCERHGVPWFDLDFTDEEWARPIRNSAADRHVNASGHRIQADKALAALRATGHLAP